MTTASAGELADAKKASGQRQINLVWEMTQAFVTVAVTLAIIYCAIATPKVDSPEIRNAFFLIVGFYFGRTNHQRVGGVGGDSAGTR